jgi:hypothetical protein
VKAFGVGLGDAVGIVGGAGYAHTWCNGAPGNPSGCYSELPGHRKFADAAGDEIYLMKGSKPNGDVSVKFSATSKLGTGRYDMAAETDEMIEYIKGIEAAAEIDAGD